MGVVGLCGLGIVREKGLGEIRVGEKGGVVE